MKYMRLTEEVSIDLGKNLEEIRDKVLKVAEQERFAIMPKIEAIHATVTRNFVEYQTAKLRGKVDFVDKRSGQLRPTGVHSWTLPYLKPMLINHNIEEKPLGRIIEAQYKTKLSNGLPGIIVTARITDQEAVERILDGRYNTVSIGADTDSAICNICGNDWLESWCDHRRGRDYDGVICKWTTGNLWFLELSFVNAPADEHAGVKEIPENQGKDNEAAELSMLLADLKENKVYDLTNDKVYAPTSDGLVEVPYNDFAQRYYYIPFNVRVGESMPNEAKAGEDPNRPKGKDKKTPIGKMKTGNQKQAYYGHNLLHGYYRKGNTNWTKDQIIKEHTRVVRIILDKGWKHTMKDGLDDTLPDDLKKRSKSQEKK